MKIKQTIKLGASLATLLIPSTMTQTHAQETGEWTARTLEEVKQDLVIHEDNQVTYTIKTGDTLSVIAEALKMTDAAMEDLDASNHFDLLHPDVELKAQYQDDKIQNLTVTDLDGNKRHYVVNDHGVEEVEALNPTTVHEAPVETAISPIVEQVDEWVQDSTPVVQSVAESTEVIQPLVATAHAEEAVPVVSESVSEPTEEQVVPATTATTAPVETPVAPAPVAEPEVIQESATSVETIQAAADELANTVANHDEVKAQAATESHTEDLDKIPEKEADPVVPVVVEESPIPEPTPAPKTVAPADKPENKGLTPSAAAYKEEVAAKFSVNQFSTYRPGDSGDHGEGRAVDFIVNKDIAKGDAIANYAISDMAANNIDYVIWQQKIYGAWTDGWEQMEDRGNPTANHMDHVHVSFNQ